MAAAGHTLDINSHIVDGQAIQASGMRVSVGKI